MEPRKWHRCAATVDTLSVIHTDERDLLWGYRGFFQGRQPAVFDFVIEWLLLACMFMNPWNEVRFPSVISGLIHSYSKSNQFASWPASFHQPSPEIDCTCSVPHLAPRTLGLRCCSLGSPARSFSSGHRRTTLSVPLSLADTSPLQ